MDKLRIVNNFSGFFQYQIERETAPDTWRRVPHEFAWTMLGARFRLWRLRRRFARYGVIEKAVVYQSDLPEDGR